MVPKVAYIIVDTEKNTKGEYVPCIVKQGETGYYLTDWSWGKDKELAQKIADKQNEGLGITQAEVHDLVLESMFKQEPVCKATVKITRKDFESELMKTLDTKILGKQQFSEAVRGKIINCTLYYSGGVHIATWSNGKGRMIKEVTK